MNRWQIDGQSIVWNVNDAHTDDIEMAGLGASFVVKYGAKEDGSLYLARHCVFPTLRTIPNNTHASWQFDIDGSKLPAIAVDGAPLTEKAVRFTLDGALTAESVDAEGCVAVKRVFFPDVELLRAYELVTLINVSHQPVALRCAGEPLTLNCHGRGTKGVYLAEIVASGLTETTLNPGECAHLALSYTGRIAIEAQPDPASYQFSTQGLTDALLRRYRRVDELTSPLSLESSSEQLDLMFRFAKLRAGESIFRTAGGLLHSPGGYSYYAATWCNDQVEYSGPYFAYTGDEIALEAALNAYMEYAPFMSDLYLSIPSSVIAEGTDIWEKDRGDEAMYAYGASLYALTRGERKVAEQLYPCIKWCIEYCLRRKNEAGVILSETDELEGRFPSGEANLSTSSLCYGGLRLAAYLSRDLMKGDEEFFTKEADALEEAIERYFGDDSLHGFHTYRYYEGNDLLRAWICLPLCMGIKTRLQGTVDALTSPYLWTADGLLTQEGTTTVWDRSTLYGLRGAFSAGAGERISENFAAYIERRLLGDRVPYAFEAYPEGSKRHLSGESALFCRIITDGIFGMSPRGLHRLSITPRLPEGIGHMYLRNIRAYGCVFDLKTTPAGCEVMVRGKRVAFAPLNEETLVELS